RSARSGLVTGVCTPVHLGRSMTVHEIVVTDEDGRRCSTVRITNHITDLPAS
ncbi:MAG TPA: thioesterase, partial [Microbacterium sp.]|nr:thioesterase [Microbacterium sp.]